MIPRGETGTGGGIPLEFLSAYSTPPTPGTSGGGLIFDRNASSYGNAITHTEGNADFTIQDTGYYEIAFHGTIGPSSGVNFPLSILLTLRQQGASVPGASARHNFQTSTDTSNVSFSQIIEVTTAPITMEIDGEGGNFIYTEIGITIRKISNL